MKNKKIVALALAVLMMLSVFTATAYAKTTEDADPETAAEDTAKTEKQEKRIKKEKVAEPDGSIGKDAAKEAALKDAGITADKVEKIRSRISKLDDGTVVYKVGFTFGEVYYSYKIDALTGSILDKTEMSAEEHEASKPQRKHGKKKNGGSTDTIANDGSSERSRDKAGRTKNTSKTDETTTA